MCLVFNIYRKFINSSLNQQIKFIIRKQITLYIQTRVKRSIFVLFVLFMFSCFESWLLGWLNLRLLVSDHKPIIPPTWVRVQLPTSRAKRFQSATIFFIWMRCSYSLIGENVLLGSDSSFLFNIYNGKWKKLCFPEIK